MWGFMTCTPQQILLVYQIRGNDMVGECEIYERGKIDTKLQWGIPDGKQLGRPRSRRN
jgi:hypothetical protein